MIYEIRTYTLKTRSLAEVEKRYGEAYEYRKKYSPLAAFWHTEVGPLNEIVQVWPYTDLSERTRIRAEASKDPNWPPKIREFVIHQQVELVTPFSFVPEITPGTIGPIFEMRCYSLTPGSLPGVMKRWGRAAGPGKQAHDAVVLLAAAVRTCGERPPGADTGGAAGAHSRGGRHHCGESARDGAEAAGGCA